MAKVKSPRVWRNLPGGPDYSRRKCVDISPRKYDLSGLPTRFFMAGELDRLLHLMESVKAEVVVEFGVHEGRNAAAAFRNVETITHYVGVDVTPTARPTLGFQTREIPAHPGRLALDDGRFELIVSPRGTFDLTAKDLPACDVCFIDGDHSRKAVEHDTAIARKIVRPGGLIIWHDDNGLPQVQVTQVLDEMKGIIHVNETWISYEVQA